MNSWCAFSKQNPVGFSLKNPSLECVQNTPLSEIKQDIELYGMSPIILLYMNRKKTRRKFIKMLPIVVFELG